MKTQTLNVEERKDIGKNYVRRLRLQGYTPAVIYGSKFDTKEIQIKTKDLNRMFTRYGSRGVIRLELENKILPTIVKEIQNDTMKGNIIHVDFQHLSADEKIRISIPIFLKGKEKVETDEEIVQQQLMELDIQCLPKDIPEGIEVDAEVLGTGESLMVADLDIMNREDIEVLSNPEEVIATLAYAAVYEEPEAEEDDELGLGDLGAGEEEAKEEQEDSEDTEE